MIKNPKLLERLERKEIRETKFSYSEALKIFEGMWKEGVLLGVLPLKDALEGIKVDINIARILNSCLKSL